MPLAGNIVTSARGQGVLHLPPGFVYQEFLGTAVVAAVVPQNTWDLYDYKDERCIIPASATDPAFIIGTDFSIEAPFLGTAGDRLKLGTTRADAAAYVSNSQPVDSNGFLQIQDVQAPILPFAYTQITAPVEFKLYLHTGNGAPAGNLAPAQVSPIIVNPPSQVPVRHVRVACWIGWLRRKRVAHLQSGDVDISVAQQRLDLGIPYI